MTSNSCEKGGPPLSTTTSDTSNGDKELIVQYILVRKDLNWTTGALIAQACHASIASISNSSNSPHTKSYLNNLENMHKIILRAEKVDDLMDIEKKLKESNISHHLWIERPENIPSCLAVSPQPKSLVQSIFKHLKLFK